MNPALAAAIERYERANLDEYGALAAGGLAAFYRTSQGLPVSRIAPETEAANQEAAAFYRGMRDRLNAIDSAALDAEDRRSHAVLRAAVERFLAETRYYWYGSPITPYRSMLFLLRMVFAAFDLAQPAASERYLSVVRDVGRCMNAVLEKVRGQLARGIVLPKRALPAIVALHRAAADPRSGSFLPGSQRLNVLEDSARERFLAQAHDAIAEYVSPAIEELCSFLTGPYAEAATEGAGQCAYPGGDEYYAHRIRTETTLEWSAGEIHERGLAIVAELRDEMARIRARTPIDPARFVPQRPEQIGEALERTARRADALLDRLFLRRPAAPFGVKRLDPELEGGMAFGYYQPGSAPGETGYYLYNGSNLAQRSVLSAAAFALHELVPGHHYEINLARENPELPRFRGFQSIATYVAAYHEGWAEYAADLGHELGLYDEPADRYGRCALDAFISSRLVVDTGLNAFGWTFERAADFLRDNTSLSETEIESEVLRYGTDLPAQGLTYKIGSLAFKRFRTKVQAALGPAFDVRRFHDRIVRGGGMPLPLVDAAIDEFVRESAIS